MSAIRDICFAISDWLWGIPILFILVGGGIFLTIATKAFHLVKPGMVWRNTLGTLFDKEEQKKRRAAGVSPVQTFFSALGCTVGTGNIVGVGAAIAVGGPGALFWMWICGLLAMAIKYSEVALSIKYREKQKEGDGYLAGPHMYIKKGLNSNFLAVLFTVLMLFESTLVCSLHSSSMIEQGSVLGIPPIVTLIVTCLILAFVVFDGLKGLVKVSDAIVPFMSVLYILCCLIVIFANIGNIGVAFGLIFKGAFSGTAAIGGFLGATFAIAVRQGLSRGVFSNDAGLGASAMLMAQAEDHKHAAEAGSWAIMETFIDTIVICTLTGLVIIISGNWLVADDGSGLARMAIQGVLGKAGAWICSISLILFAFSTLTASMHSNRVAIENITNSKVWGMIAEAACIVTCIFGFFMDITEALCWADFANVLVLTVNVFCMLFLYKDLRGITDEYFFHPTDKIKALQRQKKSK